MTGDGWGGDFVRWGIGGAAVLALHVAAGYWIVQAAERGDMAGLPEAVMIDLAPAPEEPAAPSEGAEEPPSEAEPQTEPEPEPEPEPQFAPPDFQELPPVKDFSDLIPEPVVAPDFEAPPLTELPPITDFSELLPDSALLLSASERPRARPDRREPEPEPEPQRQQTRREEPRQERQPQPQRQQSQQQQPSRQAAQPQQRASGGGSGQPQGSPGASAKQLASWQSRVGSRIASHMSRTRVPGVRGETVTVQVQISISPNGAASARLASSTGNAKVDQAIAQRAARMPGMPAPPDGQSKAFTLPIRIQLR